MLKINGGNIAASKVVGGVCKVDVQEVQQAINNMNNGNAGGLSRVILDMVKATEEICLGSLIAIFKDILIFFFFEGKLTQKWILSSLILILEAK